MFLFCSDWKMSKTIRLKLKLELKDKKKKKTRKQKVNVCEKEKVPVLNYSILNQSSRFDETSTNSI